MIDKRQRGSNDLEVIIYDLKKQIDLLKEEIQAKQIEITNLNYKIKEQIKSDN